MIAFSIIFLFCQAVKTEVNSNGFCIRGIIVKHQIDADFREGISPITRGTEPPKDITYELKILSDGKNYFVPVSEKDYYEKKDGDSINYCWKGGYYDFFR
jgi:hypothetical protein